MVNFSHTNALHSDAPLTAIGCVCVAYAPPRSTVLAAGCGLVQRSAAAIVPQLTVQQCAVCLARGVAHHPALQ
jgi:hypothetical protein